MEKYCTCSECGKTFYIMYPDLYTYKTIRNSTIKYQCSYTCYTHSDLQVYKPSYYFNIDNYLNKVEACERSMHAQGKTILNPINRRNISAKE